MVKHDGFVTFLPPRPPGDSWVLLGALGASCLFGVSRWGHFIIILYYHIIPQTELAMGASNGVGLEGAMKCSRECSRRRSLIFGVIYGIW